jgi:hypothetical protein
VRYVKPNCLLIDCSDIDANKEKMKEELFLEYEHNKTQLLLQSNGHIAPKATRNRDKNVNEIVDSVDKVPIPLLLEYGTQPHKDIVSVPPSKQPGTTINKKSEDNPVKRNVRIH